MSRPVIGICASVELARWGAWEIVATLAPRAYSDSVQAAGGLPLLLPPDDATAEAPGQTLDLIDGLMLAGGGDIDPASYGAQPHPQTQGCSPERDRFEIALAHAALERDLPVLGICRGMQLLNVTRGGTLEQHVPDAVGHERHRHTPGKFADHEVVLEPDSLAARAVGAESSAVKSHHHQGIAVPGEGVHVSGRSAEDELPEAIELPEQRFALGVLWHAEEDEHSGVIAALVAQARARREVETG